MSARLFWKQQFPLLLVHLLSMAALACFLALNGNNRDSILLILLTWAGVAGGWMVRSYLLRKHQLDALLSLSESLRETYLIGEIMQAPTRADDQVYYQILKRAGRSMLEQISAGARGIPGVHRAVDSRGQNPHRRQQAPLRKPPQPRFPGTAVRPGGH